MSAVMGGNRTLSAFCVPPPADPKLARLNCEHEQEISHRVGQSQLGDSSLAVLLPSATTSRKKARDALTRVRLPNGRPGPPGLPGRKQPRLSAESKA